METLGFQELIRSEEELRELLGYPNRVVAHKAITHLDQHCRDYIAQAPMVLMATADASGACDVSPRGDFPGFTLILDEKHLVIPERPGNRRMDSLRNLLENPHIGLIFLIPGLEETLRVNGRASIIKDRELLAQMVFKGHIPLLGIGVEVEECYVHCAKAFKRSNLWKPETWPNQADLPDIAQMMADHANLPDVSAQEVALSLEETYTKRLY